MRNQATGKSITKYAAALHYLATHCIFGEYLSDTLRDRLVCGLKSKGTPKHLLAETELMLAKAVEISQSMNAVEYNAQQLNYLATHYMLGEYLSEILRDRLVCGLQS